MVNIIFVTFSFLVLIYKRVLLLNEETLILLCFFVFVYLNLLYFGSSFFTSFKKQADEIEFSLRSSLKQIYSLFFKFSNLKNDFQLVLDKFIVLGNYYCKLIFLLVNLLPQVNKNLEVKIYDKRLKYVNNTEKQTAKLLSLIVVKKLNEITKLKQFYTVNIKSNYFLCSSDILLREYIQLINIKNQKF